jgi:hypothetical protein
MTVTAELQEMRRQCAITFFRTVHGRKFRVQRDPFGLGLIINPLVQTLQCLCAYFPPNVTYITDGIGLDKATLKQLRPHAQEPDMGEILASNPEAEVVLFGEDHFKNKNAHRFLRGTIQVLGTQGFNAYGVELLRIGDAELAKGFNNGGAKERAALQAHIQDSNNTGNMADAADTHMEIFDAAKRERMKAYPMTHPREWDDLVLAQCFFGGLRLLEQPRVRDCFMSLAANHALVERGKTIALTGLGHIDVNNGLPSVLSQGFGYRVISVALVEREDVTEPFMVQYTPEIRGIVPAYQTFSWNCCDALPQEANWIVYLPHAPRKIITA